MPATAADLVSALAGAFQAASSDRRRLLLACGQCPVNYVVTDEKRQLSLR